MNVHLDGLLERERERERERENEPSRKRSYAPYFKRLLISFAIALFDPIFSSNSDTLSRLMLPKMEERVRDQQKRKGKRERKREREIRYQALPGPAPASWTPSQTSSFRMSYASANDTPIK